MGEHAKECSAEAVFMKPCICICIHLCSNTSGTKREMGYLFESWCTAQEEWKKSTIYLTISSKNGTVRRGIKKWMTRMQLEASVGKEVAAAIIEYKLSPTRHCGGRK